MPSRPRRSWSVAGLGALVVLNVVLIGLLVLRPAPVVDDERAATSRPTASEAETLEKRETAPMLTRSGEPAQADPAEHIIVNADATTAWRVEVGQCDDPPTMERTADGGATWETLPLDLGPVSRMRVLGAESLFAIGGGEDCQPTYVSSSTAGSTWQTSDQYLEGSWYLLADGRYTMATPVGEVEAPCVPVDLAALDADDAALLCAEGTLALTADGGATWNEGTASISASAIGVTDDGYVLAGTHENCGDDVAVARHDATGEPLETSCAPADAKNLAVSGLADVLWLWGDNEVYVSTDNGQSW